MRAGMLVVVLTLVVATSVVEPGAGAAAESRSLPAATGTSADSADPRAHGLSDDEVGRLAEPQGGGVAVVRRWPSPTSTHRRRQGVTATLRAGSIHSGSTGADLSQAGELVNRPAACRHRPPVRRPIVG